MYSFIYTYHWLTQNYFPLYHKTWQWSCNDLINICHRGVTEAGWTQKDVLASTTAAKDSDLQKNKLKSDLLAIIRKTEEQQFAWPFRQPVDTTEVTDYLDVIKDPIDLSTIEKRIRKGEWYKSKQMLHTDLMRMVHNCKLYNEPKTLYYDCATQLEKFVSNLLTKK